MSWGWGPNPMGWWPFKKRKRHQNLFFSHHTEQWEGLQARKRFLTRNTQTCSLRTTRHKCVVAAPPLVWGLHGGPGSLGQHVCHSGLGVPPSSVGCWGAGCSLILFSGICPSREWQHDASGVSSFRSKTISPSPISFLASPWASSVTFCCGRVLGRGTPNLPLPSHHSSSPCWQLTGRREWTGQQRLTRDTLFTQIIWWVIWNHHREGRGVF